MAEEEKIELQEELDVPEEEPKEPVADAEDIEQSVMEAIEPCIERIKAGEYVNKNEAIDALIADLQNAKDEQGMSGLGIDEEPLTLPEEPVGEDEE